MWPLTISTKVGEVDPPLPSYWIYVYGVRCDLHQNPINIGCIYIYILSYISLIHLNFCEWTCSIWIYVFWRLKNFLEKKQKITIFYYDYKWKVFSVSLPTCQQRCRGFTMWWRLKVLSWRVNFINLEYKINNLNMNLNNSSCLQNQLVSHLTLSICFEFAWVLTSLHTQSGRNPQDFTEIPRRRNTFPEIRRGKGRVFTVTRCLEDHPRTWSS